MLRIIACLALCLGLGACDKCGNFDLNPFQSKPTPAKTCHSTSAQ